MSGRWRVMRNADTGAVLLARVRWCDSAWCRFRGLMLRGTLAPDEGLLLVYGHASVVGSSIHMFFMRFAIAVLWLDEEFRVVSKTLAKPWRPYYAADSPAQYILEAPPTLLDSIAVGDRVEFEPQ